MSTVFHGICEALKGTVPFYLASLYFIEFSAKFTVYFIEISPNHQTERQPLFAFYEIKRFCSICNCFF